MKELKLEELNEVKGGYHIPSDVLENALCVDISGDAPYTTIIDGLVVSGNDTW